MKSQVNMLRIILQILFLLPFLQAQAATVHGLVRQIDAPIHCVTFFPSFTLRILFLQINYLPEFLLTRQEIGNLQPIFVFMPQFRQCLPFSFFFFFCSDKNRKLDLDFQVVCQNRQKLEMTFATKCINKPGKCPRSRKNSNTGKSYK